MGNKINLENFVVSILHELTYKEIIKKDLIQNLIKNYFEDCFVIIEKFKTNVTKNVIISVFADGNSCNCQYSIPL